ncbi:hypothetical protein [Streptomyces sp. NPDC007929]|uniref:hypothetical protein n=1 Tax=unclassified Streptomyces TaxID=2593676 RepID=UPI0036EB9A80
MVLRHTPCGHDTEARVVCSACGEPRHPRDITARTGPGYPARLLDAPVVRDRFTSGRTLGDAPTDPADPADQADQA